MFTITVSIGDLTISVHVLFNYLENSSKVPWEDLRYLFGEIMYGGHITDDWDRRLCRTYLQEYLSHELVSSICNSFKIYINCFVYSYRWTIYSWYLQHQ